MKGFFGVVAASILLFMRPVQASDSLGDIVAVLRAREERARSFEFSLSDVTTYPPQTSGAEPVVLQGSRRLVVDGDCARLEIQDWSRRGESMEFDPHYETVVAVDGVSRRLSSETGGISPDRYIRDDLRLGPILGHYRLLRPLLGSANPQNIRLAGWAELDGHECAILEEPIEGFEQPVTYRWWLAKDMDYAFARWTFLMGGKVRQEITAQCLKDPTAGWRPDSWTAVVYQGARIYYTNRVKVEKAAFNQLVDPVSFHLAFPPGTKVTNYYTESSFVVGPDGAEGEMLGLADQGRMEEFVKAAREQVGGRFTWESPPPRWPWYAAGGVLLLATAGAGALYWRRRRRWR